MKLLKNAVIAAMFCWVYGFTSVCMAATERTYDVQILVFSHITPKTLQSEKWPAVAKDNSLAETTPIPQRAFDLQREKKMLQSNAHYKILLDASWRKTWSSNASSVTIPINVTHQQSSLNGKMVVTLGHYFDVHTHLILSEPTALLQKIVSNNYFSHWNEPDFRFELQQDRRMKSNELNYLETPLMGVLIKITRVGK